MDKEKVVYTDEFVSVYSACAGTTKVRAAEMLAAFYDSVEYFLSKGKNVQLKNFGKFFLKKKAPRVGRNPHTGDEIPIPTRTVVSFTPGKELRESIKSDAESGCTTK